MARSPRQTFEGRVLFNSAKAILFQSHFWWAPMWLPRSQIEIEEDDDEHVVKVSGWLSGKNDLNEFTEYTEEDMEVKNRREE